jgi:hypothetical protein
VWRFSFTVRCQGTLLTTLGEVMLLLQQCFEDDSRRS